MRTPRVRRALGAAGAAGAAVVVLAACADDPRIADVSTVAPPPPVAPTTTATDPVDPAGPVDPADPVATVPGTGTSEPTGPTGTAASNGTAPADETTRGSTPVVDVTVAGPASGPTFSDALGEKVTGAPGVRTPGDTRRLLPEGLYVHLAWTADPSDPSVFTPTPDDIPILEAYANAVTTFYRAAMTTVTAEDPLFSNYFVDAGAKYEAAFRQARGGGYTKDLGEGVLLRPYVLTDQRSARAAVVLDCVLSDERWVRKDSTSHVEPATVALGVAATVVRVDGSWIVDTVSEMRSACM